MPGALDDAAADADALGLERPQRRLDLRVPVERRGEGDRVVRRLGDAGADMRARDERGVADERDAAERHRRRLEVVDRLQEGLLGQPNQRPELRRQHLFGVRPHFGDRPPWR